MGLGGKIDLVFKQIRIGFFYDDLDLVHRNIDKANSYVPYFSPCVCVCVFERSGGGRAAVTIGWWYGWRCYRFGRGHVCARFRVGCGCGSGAD